MSDPSPLTERTDWVTVAEYLGPPHPGYPVDGVAEVHYAIVAELRNYTRAKAIAQARRSLSHLRPPCRALRVMALERRHTTIEAP